MSDAPDFRCPQGHSLGAKRSGPDAPWEPQPGCYLCEREAAKKIAAERRKLGPIVAGIDIKKAFEFYRKQEPFIGRLGRHVKIKVRHGINAGYSGHAWSYSRQLVVTFGPNVSASQALETLVHEMCHLACPAKEGHGERFRRMLRAAAMKLWGVEVPLLKGTERGTRENAAYAMDDLIIAELGRKISEGALDFSLLFPDAPEPAKNPADNRKALVEKRAAHVKTMLARAERRLKLAKSLHAKWSEKARYYERVAAKR